MADSNRSPGQTASPAQEAGLSREMNELWGDNTVQSQPTPSSKGRHFQDGNYGLFIHWGLYSLLGGKWREQTYYGIGEWIMNERVAGIPVEEYQAIAREFAPASFDAKAVVQLAKDAGMKYVVFTSKHHEGFAMFQSTHPFNVVDSAAFGRDPMKEISVACREANLGFGVYYSHFQDWTAPGGNGGPLQNSDGSKASFKQYFEEKCYPQVKEICTAYGPLEIIWFDTPGDMPKENVIALHDLIRETQPLALLGSRIGHGLGDYSSQGDMEIPPERIDGLWEVCDTTNDSWSFTWYDTNWKSPIQILERLIATVARGGAYLLNVGPDGKGIIPEPCQDFLRQAGRWIAQHPEVIYGAASSPWKFAMPWGDVTRQGKETLYLSVFSWPSDGRLYLPGMTTHIVLAQLLNKESPISVDHQVANGWTCLSLPPKPIGEMISVIKVQLRHEVLVTTELALHPNYPNIFLSRFAEVVGAEKSTSEWMEKFGEWKHVTQISNWTSKGAARWEFDVFEAGFYHIDLTYRGLDELIWRIETDEGAIVQNQQPATSQFALFPMGTVKFQKAGIRILNVSLVSGDAVTASLASMHLVRVG